MPAVASPSPHGGEGRGEGVRPRGQSPLTPTLPPLGRGSSYAQVRRHYISLVKTFAAVMAASLLLLVGAHASELIRVGNAGRESFSFTPANIGKEVGFSATPGRNLDFAGSGGDAKLQQAMAAN